MHHYICTGTCGANSAEPGICENPTCPKHGQPLADCYCEDGKHNGKARPQLDPYAP